ncbi:hypothetical protein F5141DRAFT_1136075 [Pisolithus sp. B1]|nr:hypothetical protein F5141DRAFT_1136075 [Pisolithus sp. B1]
MHDSNHEFWFSAICEACFIAFSQLLLPVNTYLCYAPWLRLIVIVVLFAYLVKCISSVINIPNWLFL